jgi:Tol biopolymer transport system component
VLLIRGTGAGKRAGSYLFDINTGRLQPGVLIDRPRNVSNYGPSHWSPDGRAIVYEHAPLGLVSRDLASGTETALIDYQKDGLDRITRFGISPDGSALAFSSSSGTAQSPGTVLMMKPIGGTVRELLRSQASERFVFQDWMPDGHEVLFTRSTQTGNRSLTLWRVSTTGGAPQEIALGLDRYLPLRANNFVVSPDGHTLAFGIGSNTFETWVMENFLPKFQAAGATVH